MAAACRWHLSPSPTSSLWPQLCWKPSMKKTWSYSTSARSTSTASHASHEYGVRTTSKARLDMFSALEGFLGRGWQSWRRSWKHWKSLGYGASQVDLKYQYSDTFILYWSLQSSQYLYLPNNSFFCAFASCYLEVWHTVCLWEYAEVWLFL